jgi:hypothetical protein
VPKSRIRFSVTNWNPPITLRQADFRGPCSLLYLLLICFLLPRKNSPFIPTIVELRDLTLGLCLWQDFRQGQLSRSSCHPHNHQWQASSAEAAVTGKTMKKIQETNCQWAWSLYTIPALFTSVTQIRESPTSLVFDPILKKSVQRWGTDLISTSLKLWFYKEMPHKSPPRIWMDLVRRCSPWLWLPFNNTC